MSHASQCSFNRLESPVKIIKEYCRIIGLLLGTIGTKYSANTA